MLSQFNCFYSRKLDDYLTKIKYGSRATDKRAALRLGELAGIRDHTHQTRHFQFKQWTKTVYLITKQSKVHFRNDQQAA